MRPKVQQSILRTLAWFDLFDHPLTAREVHHFLWSDKKVSLDDVDQALKLLHDEKELGFCIGFYYLQGRDEIVHIRQQRVLYVEQKMRIAHNAIKKLRYIPFLRAVCVCNTVAFGNPNKESDIDVFMIVRNGRLWFVRACANLILKMFRLRTNSRHTADKICLSFFIADSHLNIFSLHLTQPDIYQAYWLAHLIPLYDPDELLHSVGMANAWVNHYIPHATFLYKPLPHIKVVDTAWSRTVKKIIARFFTTWAIGDSIEHICRRLQLPRIHSFYGPMIHKPTSEVVVTDTVLKFHKNDRRVFYFAQWQSRCERLGVWETSVDHLSTKTR